MKLAADSARYPITSVGDNMRISLSGILRKLIIFSILMTPIFSIGEILALLTGTVESQTKAVTPIYIKVVKDVAIILMVFVSCSVILKRNRISTFMLFGLGLVGYTFVFFIVSFQENPIIAIAGLRWFLPIFLIFVLTVNFDKSLINSVAKAVIVVFVIHICLQVYQLTAMSDWYGKNIFGLAGRVPGVFFIPNTAAFFSVNVLFLTHFYVKHKSLRRLVWTLAPISILLTMSGTGVVVLVLMAFMVLVGQRVISGAVLMLPVMGVGLLTVIGEIVGRGTDYVSISLGTRIEIISSLLTNAKWLPGLFGLGTNSGVLLSSKLGIDTPAKIVDSTYASIIANFGLTGLLLFIIIFFIWVAVVVRVNKLELYIFTMVYALFGATTIISEAFPLNLIFAVLAAYYLNTYFRFNMQHSKDVSAAPVINF